MTNKGLSKLGLNILDRTTDVYPAAGPKIFQRLFVGLFGSRLLSEFFLRRYRKQWNAARVLLDSPRAKILVIVDVCIGDAVLASECLPMVRDSFPNAEIHYVCNKTGGELIEGMPGVRVHNIIQGERGFPTEDDLHRLRTLVDGEQFTVVLNLGPFVDKKSLGRDCRMIQLYVPLAAYVLRAWKENKYRHISYLSRAFVSEFLAPSPLGNGSQRQCHKQLNTNTVYLSSDAITQARVFLQSRRLSSERGIVFFNPDATSQFGQIPFEIQSRLLQHIAGLKQVSAILFGRPYSNVAIERALIETLSPAMKNKVHLVPHMPIETYTALIDASDMFISGDTGPLHIAACRKLATNDPRMTDHARPLRNKTVVLAIYGATDSRMYGYDSEQPFHAPANQDVPSRSFSAPATCRNISCINKFGKSCSEVRCFDHLPIDNIFDYITSYFKSLSGEWVPLEIQESNRLIDSIVNEADASISLQPEREYAF